MKRVGLDPILLLSMVGLTFVGLVFISSSSYFTASEMMGDRYFFIKRHCFYLCLAWVAFFIAFRINIQGLRKLAIPLLIVSAVLLILTVASPLASYAGGASRWIKLAGFRFQPSEFARLATILFLAYYLTQEGVVVNDFRRGLLIPLIITGTIALFILSEPDFGSAVSIVITCLILLYIGGGRLKHLAICLLTAAPLVVYTAFASPYRRERLLTFLNPWKDPMDRGFQIIQSFIAIRSGGFFGQGIGDGLQKIFYLPEAHTDFAFAIIGEELGLFGIALVLALFLVLVARGAYVSIKNKDRFQSLLGAGIVFAVGVQAFTNMAVVVGMLPTKGMTLPLISFGGSSLIATYASIGLLHNIAKQAREMNP